MYDLIFIVDQDVRRRASISYYLNNLGNFAEPFETIEEFVRPWPKSGVILVHDYGKAVSSLMHELCSRHSWLPIVAFSENPKPAQVVEAVFDGAIGYVDWPGCGDTLTKVLRDASTRTGAALGDPVRRWPWPILRSSQAASEKYWLAWPKAIARRESRDKSANSRASSRKLARENRGKTQRRCHPRGDRSFPTRFGPESYRRDTSIYDAFVLPGSRSTSDEWYYWILRSFPTRVRHQNRQIIFPNVFAASLDLTERLPPFGGR
jgi:hypothetical protein